MTHSNASSSPRHLHEVGAYGDNLALVAEGAQLRKQTAALLGYGSWAHYVTEARTHTPSTAPPPVRKK